MHMCCLDRFKQGIKCKMSTVIVINPWSSLPRGVADSPSLAIFKSSWDVFLKDLL